MAHKSWLFLLVALMTAFSASAATYDYWRDPQSPSSVWVKVDLQPGQPLILSIANTSGYAQDPHDVFLYFCDADSDHCGFNPDNVDRDSSFKKHGAASLKVNTMEEFEYSMLDEPVRMGDNYTLEYWIATDMLGSNQNAWLTLANSSFPGYKYHSDLTYPDVAYHALSPDDPGADSIGYVYIPGSTSTMTWYSFSHDRIGGTIRFCRDIYSSPNCHTSPLDSVNGDYTRMIFIKGRQQPVEDVHAWFDTVRLRKAAAHKPEVSCTGNTCTITSSERLEGFQVALTTGLKGNLRIEDKKKELKIIWTSPKGKIRAKDGKVVLAAFTNKDASCRYSTADESYSDMDKAFWGSQMAHYAHVSVEKGEAYEYFVRCVDGISEKRKVISFRTVGDASPWCSEWTACKYNEQRSTCYYNDDRHTFKRYCY